MKIKKRNVLLGVLAGMFLLALCLLPFRNHFRRPAIFVYQILRGRKTIPERVAEYAAMVHGRLGPSFTAAGVNYPPAKVTLVGVKSDRVLQVWVAGPDGQWKHLKDYPILGMSGKLGPKLVEGDGQVPEGIYHVDSLNPNSIIHLSVRLNYPNDDDLRHAKIDGRTNLGSNIMIHGRKSSAGCLALGNPASEDVFVLVAETGLQNVSIILTPVDFRSTELPTNMPPLPKWGGEVYATIKAELARLAGGDAHTVLQPAN